MKILCRGKHWWIKDNQLVLGTPDGQDALKKMITVLEAQIRDRIYDEICAIDLTTDRKRVMKNGIDNALLTVQDICAQVALGNKNEK